MQSADAKLMLNDAKSTNDAKLMQNSDAKIENIESTGKVS